MIVKERYVPTWRRPKRKRRRLDVPLHSPILFCTLVTLLLLLAPIAFGDSLNEAISLQLHAKKPYAWALVGSLAFLGTSLIWELVRQRRLGSSFVLATCLGLLGLISVTDPYSSTHLGYYVFASLLAVAWLFAMACDLDCAWLYKFSAAAFLCVVTSAAALGSSERLLIACLVLGMNVLYFGHLK